MRTQYQHLCIALDEYIRKTFYEWNQTVEKVSIAHQLHISFLFNINFNTCRHHGLGCVRYSSMVERSLMVRWVHGLNLHGVPIELFLIPASAPQLVY